MPRSAQQRPIKGLNKGPGQKRFVFKSFSRRVAEVDIDVFRSLVPLKVEPTTGSSFFHESLVAWRELNSAVEFTSVYEVLLPVVQTLPQLLLHKEKIIGMLLSKMQLSAIHSLEPILSLIAILSRDLRADFMPFLPEFFKACTSLLLSGGDREPDIIEQVFTSISYIFKYMQTILCKDIIFVLKATKGLRYFRSSYIEDFTADAVSYLLRNASLEQLVKGVRRLFAEVMSKPSNESVSSCSSLIWHTLKGPGTTLHSRAEIMLQLFFDDSTFKIVKKKDPGGKIMVEVLSKTFCRLCEELDRKKLSLLWTSLLAELNSLLEYEDSKMFENDDDKTKTKINDKEADNDDGLEDFDKTSNVVYNSESQHDQDFKKLIILLLVNNLLEFRKGRHVYDFEPIFSICHKLLQSNFKVFEKEVGSWNMSTANVMGVSELCFQVLRLLLAIIKSHSDLTEANIGPSAIVSRVHSWAMIWNYPNYPSLLYFIQGLLEQDSVIIEPFFPNILRMLDQNISVHSDDILPLVVSLFGKVEKSLQNASVEKYQCQNIASIVVSMIENATMKINGSNEVIIEENKPAVIWAALNCYPYLVPIHNLDRCLVWSFIHRLDNWLSTTQESCEDKCARKVWEFVLGTAIMSELKAISYRDAGDVFQERARVALELAIRYKDSPYVLKSIVDFLDLCFRKLDAINLDELVPVELGENQALSLFGNNLGSSSKLLRLSTLRLLIHLESTSAIFISNNDCATYKKQKVMDGRSYKLNFTVDGVFESLKTLEAASFTLELGRQSSVLLSRLKMKASAKSFPESFLVPLTNALVGILTNSFRLIWEAAVDCLAGFLEMQIISVWETFVQHLGFFQKLFVNGGLVVESKSVMNAEVTATETLFNSEFQKHEQYEGTDMGTMVSLLLQAAQKASKVADSRSRQLVPLFLAFIDGSVQSSTAELKPSNSRKDWKVVLKEWLTLLGSMKNATAYFKSSAVKEALINRFLMDGDPEIQSKALDCISNWKDSYLMPYEEHLRNLISFKAVREEIITWNIGRGSEHIQSNHRDGLIPIILRLLFPKILKTKTKHHNKSTGGIQRKGVLAFLADLDVDELVSFYILILKPLKTAFTDEGLRHAQEGVIWEIAMKQGAKANFIDWVATQNVANLSYKKRSGFLHMFKDMLETFDYERVTPGIHALLAFCFRILQSCNTIMGVDALNSCSDSAESISINGAKDLRTLAFKVLGIVWSKYDDLEFHPMYWDVFFGIARPLIVRFKEEGASGDVPSALFSCFLAMSKSSRLVSVLQREEVIPNVVLLLSYKNASAPIVGAALTFIENIVELEEENRSLVTNIVLSHLPLLLTNIKTLLSLEQRLRSKKFSSCVKRGLHLLMKISRHITNPVDAVDLFDVLIAFLAAKKKSSEDELLDVLTVLRELASKLTSDACEAALPFLGQLLSSCSNLDLRSLVCQVVCSLSTVTSSLSVLAKLVSDLNAISVTTVGEYDYERRLQAYGQLSAELFGKLSYNQAHLLISQTMYDIKSDDISIRLSASNCLVTFIHFLGSVFREAQENPGVFSKNGSSWGSENVKLSVQKLLLPNVRNAMCTDALTVRREWITVLKEMASNLHFISPLDELIPLISTDAEVDFFNNIVHIQTHRRIRAISRFKELCSANKFSQGCLIRIFKPLFMNSLFESKGDKDSNLVQSAVEAISCIAAQLQWDPYYSLLIEVFRMMNSHTDNEKVLIKLLCSILDKFHFHQPLLSNGRGEDVEEKDSEQFNDHHSIPDKIERQLRVHVLPEFTKRMISDSNLINMSAALAVVKILQLMRKEVVDLELPRVIQNIVNLLKNRSQVVRDKSRACLISICSLLGPLYFGFIIEKLQEALKRGYEVHVLGFTLNALVAKTFPTLQVGEIDYCVERVLKLLDIDIFEDVAEEKEVEKIAFKMKESKRTGSYESIKIVAQSVTFQLHCCTLLKLVEGRLKDALVPKTKSKIEKALRQLALGIQLNPSVKHEELLTFIHGLVEDGMTCEKSLVLASAYPTGGNVVTRSETLDLEEKVRRPNQYLITEFALNLLEFHLKRTKLKRSDPAVLSMLDPMVQLLESCLGSKHGAVLFLALKCLSHLLRYPLPSFDVIGEGLVKTVFYIVQGAGKGETKVAQACFNILVALLKHAKGVHISEEQIHMMLQLPVFVDLETAENNTGLVLLKAIVSRKLLIPALYDIIYKISNLMVKSNAVTVRQYCSQIILQFLLDYPLGLKRLQQHLDFFVSNLGYQHLSGREAVLEMLHAIIVKFPVQAVDEQVETFYLPLVTRLVNEESNQLRAMVGSILKVLMGKVSQRSLQRMLNFCFSWLKGNKQQLWRAASQVLGLAVEVVKENFSTYLEETFQSSVMLLINVMETNNVEKNAIVSVGPVLWQEAYHVLVMLEKMLRQFPDVCYNEICQDLWELLGNFLLHRHLWIRKVSSRLLDVYFTFSAVNANANLLSVQKIGQQTVLFQPSWLMLLVAIICKQLDCEIDESLGELIKKNLLFACLTLRTIFVTKGKLSWMGFINEDDPAAQARVRKALHILKVQNWIRKQETILNCESRKPSEIAKHKHDGDKSDCEYYAFLPVFWYLKKTSLEANDIQLRTLFDLYQSFTTCMGRDEILPYLQNILLPLYRTAEGVAARVVSEDVKSISANVLNHIKEIVGSGEFVQAYNEIRQAAKGAREERRRTQKLRAMIDPKGHARKKMKLNAQKKIKKKKRYSMRRS